MKILFYVEPHLIRGNRNAFKHVADYFIKLVMANSSHGYESKLYANEYIFSTLKPDIRNKLHSLTLPPTAEEELIFAHTDNLSEKSSLDIWLQLIKGIGITEKYYSILERLFQIFPFDVIVHWGENGAISKFSKDYRITHVGIELGCTRPPFRSTLAFDIFGTNGAAIIPKLEISQIKEIVQDKFMSAEEAIFCHSEKFAPSSVYASAYAPFDFHKFKRILSHQKTVFFPLQLYDDINLVNFSPYTSIEEVVRDVVPKIIKNGYKVIIKTHPLSSKRQSGLLENEIARSCLEKWTNDIAWVNWDSGGNSQLIQRTSFTLTVNSSIGFEATYFDKPVVVLGDAVYKPKGLFPNLDDIFSNKFDLVCYQKNLGYLREFLLGAYLQDESTLINPSKFKNYISILRYADITCNGKAKEIASIIYKAMHPLNAIDNKYHPLIINELKSNKNEFPKVSQQKDAEISTFKDIIVRLINHSGAKDLISFNNWLDIKSKNKSGILEIIDTGKIIDIDYYLSNNIDVKKESIDPIIHYVNNGINEGRSPQNGIKFLSKEMMIKELKNTAKSIF